MGKPIVEVTMDCADAPRMAEFWAAALGYDVIDAQPGQAYLNDPEKRGPFLCLLEVPEPKSVKNRMHFDLVVSGDGTEEEKWRRVVAEAARLEALGATIRREGAPTYIGMNDPEGNEFDVT